MTDLKLKLNPSQLEAVTTISGPLLVIAGAGSGKTRVIEYRVLNMVVNNIEPSSILLLTFTREAARKMLERSRRAGISWWPFADMDVFYLLNFNNMQHKTMNMAMQSIKRQWGNCPP